MAVSFNIPASPKIQIYQNENFLGCDFTSDGSTVDDTHSPDCLNMTRLVPGKVRKRMGYREITDYHEHIYGVHRFSTTDTWLVHAGNKIYNLSAPTGEIWIDDDGNEVVDYDENNIMLLTGNVDVTMIYEGMAEQRSFSLELGLKLVIMDGTHLYTFDGTEFKVLTGENAYTWV